MSTKYYTSFGDVSSMQKILHTLRLFVSVVGTVDVKVLYERIHRHSGLDVTSKQPIRLSLHAPFILRDIVTYCNWN